MPRHGADTGIPAGGPSPEQPADASEEIASISYTSGYHRAQFLATLTALGIAQVPSPIVEIPGVEKSAVYKINPDSSVETLWSSKEENVYSMVVEPNGGIVFSTDAQGRVYRLNPDRKASLLVETSEGEATRLLQDQGGLLAATGDMGKLPVIRVLATMSRPR